MFSALNTATINQGDSQPGLGTFSAQPGASQAAPAPTDTTEGYFTYGANYGQIQSNDMAASTAGGGVNQATGGISGVNPLGYNTTDTTSLASTNPSMGYSAAINPITGQAASTVQTNPSLQALAASRSLT
jgi:hypothetical protein